MLRRQGLFGLCNPCLPSRLTLTPFFARNGALIVDGGLATELEARGYQLTDGLWSARLLDTAPQAIQQVHADYLAAGADCIITASYQASLPGFLHHGYSQSQAVGLLHKSVELALNAREAFWSKADNRSGRLRPLVAASIGPYGAYLADGSEYTGRYDLSETSWSLFIGHAGNCSPPPAPICWPARRFPVRLRPAPWPAC